LGIIWLTVMGLILGGVVLAPYMGQITDFVLHQTVYRQWTRLTLEAEQSFFDLSTPPQALRSYYSALYHGDGARMAQLTEGSFQEQMRQRVATTTTAPAFTSYRSFLLTEQQGEHDAVVLEKFHLFWNNSLRFVLQRDATQWRIVNAAPVP
jgi:hypothetical protein